MIVGRPKGSKNKLQRTQEAIQSPVRIDTTKSININTDYKKDEFRCWCCGNKYDKLQGHFTPTNHPLFKKFGYYPVCKRCTDGFVNEMIDFYNGSEEKAIEYVCMMYGLYFHESPLAASKKISEHRSRFHTYSSKVQIRPWVGKSWLDVLKERETSTITSIEEFEQLRSEGRLDVSKASAERWGIGIFNDADYKILDDHYKMLKRQNPNCDSNQEIFIKDLCYTKLQQMNAMRDKKSDDFKTFTQLYRETFKQAGLKTIQENDSSNDEVFGVTLATISQYTPEEYYKDKQLYKDFDGLGDYISRFITRPLKNLMLGSHERDKEFFVKDGGDEE